MFDVIIAASGESTRFGLQKNKLLVKLNDRSVLENSIIPFLTVDGLEKIIVATSVVLFDEVKKIADALSDKIIVTLGGDTRTETVRRALGLVTAQYVLIHDGARPFVSHTLIENVLNTTSFSGACIPTLPLEESLAMIGANYTPMKRADFRTVQTPQGFLTASLKSAYASASGEYTDDASVYLTKFKNVDTIYGEKRNKKITTKDDLCVVDCLVGVGFDTHRLTEGRKLVLGGVEIPFEKGLEGHSDADVLVHAIMDALLSAAGLRDIGYFFPDNDNKYKGADSMKLLDEVVKMLLDNGLSVNNVAATVVAEKPKLSPYIPLINQSLATALGTSIDNVSVLATTTEKLGDIGKGLAMSAFATATIIKKVI